MSLVIDSQNILFTNKEFYEKELNKYHNDDIKKKIEKKLKSFEESISRFSYHIKEIMYEFENLYDFAICYHSKYILSLIFKYQKDKNLFHQTYEYLKERCKNSPETCNELFKYYESMKTPENITEQKKKLITTVDKESLKFIELLDKVFNANDIINELCIKNIHEDIIFLLKKKDFQNLFNFSFDNEIYELVMFLYIYCERSFDYDKLIVSNNNSNQNSYGLSSAVESSNGGNVSFSAHITVSKDMMVIFKNMYYLKKYSHMYGPHTFMFNKKYIKNIEHIFGRKIDHYEIFEAVKNIL